MSRRVLILPLSAAIIAALVIYRLQRDDAGSNSPAAQPPAPRRLAPRFELYDQQGQLVKFERYLGRTRLIVVFFDAESAADRDPYLMRLRDNVERVEAAGVQVIGISTATPFANRQAAERSGEPFPFPLLTDIGMDPQNPAPAPVHRLFGLYDAETRTTRTGVFLVDRAGMVPAADEGPVPVANPAGVIEMLCRGVLPAGF